MAFSFSYRFLVMQYINISHHIAQNFGRKRQSRIIIGTIHLVHLPQLFFFKFQELLVDFFNFGPRIFGFFDHFLQFWIIYWFVFFLCKSNFLLKKKIKKLKNFFLSTSDIVLRLEWRWVWCWACFGSQRRGLGGKLLGTSRNQWFHPFRTVFWRSFWAFPPVIKQRYKGISWSSINRCLNYKSMNEISLSMENRLRYHIQGVGITFHWVSELISRIFANI